MCSLAQYIGTPRKPKRLKIHTSQHGPKQAKQPLKLIKIKPNSNLVVFVNFTTELNSFSRNGTAFCDQELSDDNRMDRGRFNAPKITAPIAQP